MEAHCISHSLFPLPFLFVVTYSPLLFPHLKRLFFSFQLSALCFGLSVCPSLMSGVARMSSLLGEATVLRCIWLFIPMPVGCLRIYFSVYPSPRLLALPSLRLSRLSVSSLSPRRPLSLVFFLSVSPSLRHFFFVSSHLFISPSLLFLSFPFFLSPHLPIFCLGILIPLSPRLPNVYPSLSLYVCLPVSTSLCLSVSISSI